jgi:Na+/melibiose symporter-like transporter
MCGFLMSFLGCLDGDAGVCATGLTFAVIFVISLVSCLLEFKPLLRRVELREQMSRTGFASTQFLVHNDCVKFVIEESESFSLVTKLMKRQRVLAVHVLPKVWLLPFCR